MSVVSLARAAGVTGLLSKRRLWMVSTSLVLAAMSMMSTSFCLDDLRDDVAELGEAAIAQLAAVRFRRAAGSADGQGHVGVLGVGEDEVLAAVRIGVDAGQLEIERFLNHDLFSGLTAKSPRTSRQERRQRIRSMPLADFSVFSVRPWRLGGFILLARLRAGSFAHCRPGRRCPSGPASWRDRLAPCRCAPRPDRSSRAAPAPIAA